MMLSRLPRLACHAPPWNLNQFGCRTLHGVTRTPALARQSSVHTAAGGCLPHTVCCWQQNSQKPVASKPSNLSLLGAMPTGHEWLAIINQNILSDDISLLPRLLVMHWA